MRTIWLAGHSGSGKTTIAKRVIERLNPTEISVFQHVKRTGYILLDGDEMRQSISLGAGFTPEERSEHNLRVARLASVLQKQVNVFVSVIAPVKKTRLEINKVCNPVWFWMVRDLPEREGHFFEDFDPQKETFYLIDNDRMNVEQSASFIISELAKEKVFDQLT